jgi:two-component system, NarL family, sensor histidine kinase DesK
MAGTDAMTDRAETDRRPSLTQSGVLVNWRGPGTGSPMRWFFTGIWLVYLIQPVSSLFSRGHGVLWIAGGVALTMVFCTVYILVIGIWDRRPRDARNGLAVIVVLAVVACLVYGAGWTSLWIYVSAATGCVLPGKRSTMLAVTGVGCCYVLLSWIAHVSPANFLVILLPVLLVGWAMIGFRMQALLMRELRQARETVAKLAANEERLRLARDMHDLTGQSLSLITLKSELAAKRLGGLALSAERDAALSEIADIGRVSRQTLHDIREAVSGYRRPTLAVEIITARMSLESAGIGLDDDPALTLRSGTFGPESEAALAWCLREAVTNVIRHSRARNCRIRLTERAGELSLEVSDDGRGLNGTGRTIRDTGPVPAGSLGSPDPGNAAGADRPDGGSSAGSGLHGMSERLSAVGGRFWVGPADRDAGFRVIATVPGSPATSASGTAEATPAAQAAPVAPASQASLASPASAASPAAHTGAGNGRPATAMPGARDANVPS